MKNEIIDVMIVRQAYPHSSSNSEIPRKLQRYINKILVKGPGH